MGEIDPGEARKRGEHPQIRIRHPRAAQIDRGDLARFIPNSFSAQFLDP
jgi:hypothetical protein